MKAALSKNQFSAPEATKKVDLVDFYPLIAEILSQGGTFSLTITGSSMWPTILGGRDQVTLIKAPDQLKKYDLPLYRRKNGQFVLHRIVSVNEDGTYDCCGDHQTQIEHGLRQEQMIGLAVNFVRKGKAFTADNRHYCRWVKFWCAILRFRPVYFKIHHFNATIYSYAKVAFRKIFKQKRK